MSAKKDILFLCQFFYPEFVSSATLPYDTAKALTMAGFRVSVLCGYPKEYNNRINVVANEIYEGIEIHRVKYLQLKRTKIFGRLINYFSFSVAVFSRVLSFRNFALIIVYSNPPILPLIALIGSKLFGTKLVFVCYDVYPEIAIRTNILSEKSVISKVMRFINKILYSNVSKVVALSNDMARFLLENRSLKSPNQVKVIPNWYEDTSITRVMSTYKNSLFECFTSENKFIVSYFGNMGIAQDLNTLLEAIRELKDELDIVFVFAGHGTKLMHLKDTVEKEQLNNAIIFEYLHGNDFQDALNVSNVFVVSLENGVTGLAVPSKTYSYMMAGKPIISIMNKDTDISKDIVSRDAGYSIEVGDVSSLSRNSNKNKYPK